VPSFLPHIVVPGLVALAFFPIERKRILLLAPLVWLPDVDYIVPAQHRAVTHSVLIPIVLFGIVLALWRRRDPTSRFWEFATRPGHLANMTLASFYIGSHLLMDVFQGGVVLLWPLLNTNFYLAFEILLNTGTNTFTPAGEGGTSEGAPQLAPLYPWFSTEHTAIAVFLASCVAVAGTTWLWRRSTGRIPPKPVIIQRKARLREHTVKGK
jgi:hypothetical protein